MSEANASRPLSSDADTIPKLLLRNAQRFPERPACRHKDLGIWQTHTWAQARDQIRDFAIGLHTLGVERGHTVAIVGDNLPRLYWTFTTAQSLGAVPVPIYQDSVAEEMAYVLQHAEISLAVVENQEQVDKLLSIAEQVPTLKHIVYSDPRGLQKYDHTHLHSYADVQKIGAEQVAANAQMDGWWREQIAAGSGADTSVMLYTSGTTGRPKGVILSGENLVRTAANANRFDKLTENDEIIAYLPMAWVGDHIFSYAQSFEAGFCVACPESPATAVQDRREIGPTFFFAPPRLFEALLTDITVRMQDAGWTKRALFDNFMKVAKRCGEKILEGKSVNPYDRLMYSIGNILVYAPLRNRLGFSRLRIGYTAGEAIGPEIFSFYRSIGVNLKQLYGQTEASVYITMQPDGEIFPDTVGKPAPEVDITIADSGEVMFRGPGVFQHYHKNPEATAETKTEEGWVHSGDAGFFDQRGHLVIIDRAKDVGRLNGGALFAPKYIEEQVQVLPGSPRSGCARSRPRFRDVDGEHRHDVARQLGRAQQHRLCQLSGTRRPSAGLRYDPRARGGAQRVALQGRADGRLADPSLPGAAQGTRRRRWRTDTDAEGAPLVHRRTVCAAHRSALHRRRRGTHLHRGDVRGWPQGLARRPCAHCRCEDICPCGRTAAGGG